MTQLFLQPRISPALQEKSKLQSYQIILKLRGSIAQLVAGLTQEPDVLSLIPGLATYSGSPQADSRRVVVSYWQKYVHLVLAKCSGALSLPRSTVKILKIGTPEIITIIVLQLEQLDFTVQYCVQKMQTE